MNEYLGESIVALQDDLRETLHIFDLMIAQPSVSQSPDVLTKAINELELIFAKFINLMRRNTADSTERAHTEMMAESLAAQLDGAKMFAARFAYDAPDGGAKRN